MRTYLSDFEMRTPKTLAETLDLLATSAGQWKLFAGGTDLMVILEAGAMKHRKFLNILPLSELKGIKQTKTHLTIGALATYSEIREHAVVKKEFPNLVASAKVTGAIAIQNRGTLGGNIANASPAADSPPSLLVYDAEVEIVSSSGSRWVNYADFHLGYKKMAMSADELIRAVRLSRPAKGVKHFYRKVGARKAQAISKVCFAGTLKLEKGKLSQVRIALGSVGPTPLRCRRAEAVLEGQKFSNDLVTKAKAALLKEITPIDDIRSTGAYRLKVSANLLEEFLEVCGTGSRNSKS